MTGSLRRARVRGNIAARHVILLGVVGAVVVGCGEQPTAESSAAADAPISASEAAAEAAPSIPGGWQTFEDESGSLRLSLPLDLDRIEGFPGVSAQLATEPPTFAIEVHAEAAPDRQPPKPCTESTVQAWLLERLGGWVGRVGNDQVTQVQTSVVELPAGEAIRVEAQLRPGGPDVIEVVAYAIPSTTGIADLHILALPEYWETRGDDLALIPRLLELGE